MVEYNKDNNLIDGFEYDKALGYAYTRLYLIQKKKGLIHDADNSLEKGVQYYFKGGTDASVQISKHKEYMINLVNKLDDIATVKPKWKINDAKTEAPAIQSIPE